MKIEIDQWEKQYLQKRIAYSLEVVDTYLKSHPTWERSLEQKRKLLELEKKLWGKSND